MINTLIGEIVALRKDFKELKTSVDICQKTIIKDALYTNKDIRQILGVDERLVKKYRDEGLLTFHRVGDKYWYKGGDILNFLDRCRYESFR